MNRFDFQGRVRRFRDWVEQVIPFQRVSRVRWMLLGVGIGLMAGLAATAFHLGLEASSEFLLNDLAGVDMPEPGGMMQSHPEGARHLWLIPLMTSLVGLGTGWLVQRYASGSLTSGTDGTDAMIQAFHHREGHLDPGTCIIRSSTSILTIAAGGSAGVEGPISQLAAGIGSLVARRMHLSESDRRIMLLVGAAGGLGAIFHAPLGGALTAIEVIYREDFEAEACLPAVLSSVVAYCLSTLLLGRASIFSLPSFVFRDVRELPLYLLAACACAAAGHLYVGVFRTLKYRFFVPLRQRIGTPLTAALGGLGAGLLGMQYPVVLSSGMGWLEQAILGHMSIGTMLGAALGKIVATSLTIGSGMSGGMFAPALFVGGMSGGAVGHLCRDLWPGLVTDPGAYALVGMAAFFAGVAKAPIGPLLMVCELTQGYGLLAPLMLGAVVSLWLSHRVHLYENQVDTKFDSPAHAQDMTINVLEGLQVSDFFTPRMVPILEEGSTLGTIADVVANTGEMSYPVRRADGHISGILSVPDVRQVLLEPDLFDLLVAGDIARPVLLLRPADSLYGALLAFVEKGLLQLPVVDPDDDTKVLGLLDRTDVFAAYSQAMPGSCALPGAEQAA